MSPCAGAPGRGEISRDNPRQDQGRSPASPAVTEDELRGCRTARLAQPPFAPAEGLASRCAGRVGLPPSAWWRRCRRAVRRGTRPGVPPPFEESLVPLEGVVEPGGLYERGDGLARVRGDLDDPVGQPGASSLLDRPDVLPGDGPSSKTPDSDGVRRHLNAQRPEPPRACRAGAAEAQAQPTEPCPHPAARQCRGARTGWRPRRARKPTSTLGRRA